MQHVKAHKNDLNPEITFQMGSIRKENLHNYLVSVFLMFNISVLFLFCLRQFE
jgi:hypothetical protein